MRLLIENCQILVQSNGRSVTLQLRKWKVIYWRDCFHLSTSHLLPRPFFLSCLEYLLAHFFFTSFAPFFLSVLAIGEHNLFSVSILVIDHYWQTETGWAVLANCRYNNIYFMDVVDFEQNINYLFLQRNTPSEFVLFCAREIPSPFPFLYWGLIYEPTMFSLNHISHNLSLFTTSTVGLRRRNQSGTDLPLSLSQAMTFEF